MTEAELIEYLKNHLRVEIEVKEKWAKMGDGHWRTVESRLILNDEVISTDEDRLPIEG